jgi:methylmalonyl-CoA mutase, N-terminal domain
MAICGYHVRDSGSTAVQELAFTFADAIVYIREVLNRGLSIDAFAPKLFVFLSADIDILEEVAKFRAARRIWARLMKERFGAENQESMRLNILAYTLGGSLTAQQPINNVTRVALGTLAAVLGGVQTLATSSYDEALGLPTEEAVTVALRTQQIVANESGVTSTVDPLGGSYAIEALTDAIEEQVMIKLKEIDNHGGAIACVEKGIIQKELGESAFNYQKQIEKEDTVIVGLNRYRSKDKTQIPVFQTDEDVQRHQIDQLRELKKKRDQNAVDSALQAVEHAVRGEHNTMPATIEAVKAYATVGEISDVLRKIYGEHRDPAIF